MITNIIQIEGTEYAIMQNGDLRKVVTGYGNSTDAKPTSGYRNADRFYEMDTKKVYLFDEDNGAWVEQ